MGLPLKIKNKLALGDAVAVEVKASRPDHRAWVYVRPIMAANESYQAVLGRWTREREARCRYDSTIKEYQARYIELTPWHVSYRDRMIALNYDYDLEDAIRERPIVDLKISLRSEDELEQWLLSYLEDIAALRSPYQVNYPGWF